MRRAPTSGEAEMTWPVGAADALVEAGIEVAV